MPGRWNHGASLAFVSFEYPGAGTAGHPTREVMGRDAHATLKLEQYNTAQFNSVLLGRLIPKAEGVVQPTLFGEQ